MVGLGHVEEGARVRMPANNNQPHSHETERGADGGAADRPTAVHRVITDVGAIFLVPE
jgi:hypothetical protein